ncbi:MAG: polysulfide reductase NrfD [Nitrospirae bacterium]|nr:polysulfide reductase NrfD [Nitrospirota bacterium]
MIKKIIWSVIGLVIGVVLLVIGGIAFSKLLKEGHIITNYTSYVPWGLGVSWYVYLVWLEVGTLLSFAILVYIFGLKHLKSIATILYLSGFLILTSAVLTILMDIGKMQKAFDIFFKPHFSSMIAWMAWMHVAYSGVVGLELLISILANRGAKFAIYIDTAFGWIPGMVSIVAGTVLISIIGTLFSTVSGMAAWRGGSLPLLFLLSSLVAGIALLSIIYIAFSPDKGTDVYSRVVKSLGKTTLAFIVIAMIAGFGVSVTLRTSVIDAYFSGAYNAIWAVILGLVIPIIILLLQLTSNAQKSWYMLTAASILMLISLWVIPYNVIINPQMVEPIPGIAEAFLHEKLTYLYTPSRTEVALNMLPIGIAILGFTLGYWILNWISPLKPTAGKEV